MKRLIAGNWKMYGLRTALSEVEALADLLAKGRPKDADILICPPATLLAAMAPIAGAAGIETGGQDCHPRTSGAHTGDISAEMLKDAGASYVIVGHSERRADHNESDALVRAKAEAAIAAGLVPIICVGETRAEREAGKAERIVSAQMAGSIPASTAASGVVVAYEPVWAIGTGLTPTVADIAAMHAVIRERIGKGARILYGGSVKPSNAAEILAIPNVDGALVGGASLKAGDFYGVISPG